jgi:ATP/ADP translocase
VTRWCYINTLHSWVAATIHMDVKTSPAIAYLYYVWMGVFALFNSSLFWSVATDVYNEESASRLFGLVAAGKSNCDIWNVTTHTWPMQPLTFLP